MESNTYSNAIKRAREILGSYPAIGRVCGRGLTGEAVRQWYLQGHPPRTEYTGETSYAEAISKATEGKVTVAELRPMLGGLVEQHEKTKIPGASSMGPARPREAQTRADPSPPWYSGQSS